LVAQPDGKPLHTFPGCAAWIPRSLMENRYTLFLAALHSPQ